MDHSSGLHLILRYATFTILVMRKHRPFSYLSQLVHRLRSLTTLAIVFIVLFFFPFFCVPVVPVAQSEEGQPPRVRWVEIGSDSIKEFPKKGRDANDNPKVDDSLEEVIESLSDRVVSESEAKGEGSARESEAEGVVNPADLSNSFVKVDSSSRIQVYVYCNEISEGNLKKLSELGFEKEIIDEEYRIIQGWIPYDKIEQVAKLGFVKEITPPSYGTTNAGSVTTNGDEFLGAKDVRSELSVDGAGVKIGVISDGVRTLRDSKRSGDLPNEVEIGYVENCHKVPTSCNEGTAMLEIVHDIAPGAQLGFYYGFTTVAFKEGVDYFRKNRYDIIVDDILFFLEPYFEDGPVARKAKQAVDEGIIFVSAAGNTAKRHYQAPYNYANGYHDFDSGASSTDVHLSVDFKSATRCQSYVQAIDSAGKSFAKPEEITREKNFIHIHGEGKNLKEIEIFIKGGCELEGKYATPGDSIVGHAAVPGVIAVGAVDENRKVRDYSSRGPSSIMNGRGGFERRPKPDVVALDGVETSAKGFESFKGTSAAAPHVAGIVALMIQGYNRRAKEAGIEEVDKLERAKQITNILKCTAGSGNCKGHNNTYGYGIVNAQRGSVQRAISAGESAKAAPPPVTDGGSGGGGCSLWGEAKNAQSGIIDILMTFAPLFILILICFIRRGGARRCPERAEGWSRPIRREGEGKHKGYTYEMMV